MNDTYFFGKRMSFNEGGRARFNVGGTGNQDAEAQGLDYISNNQYLQDDFTGSTPLDFSNVSSSGIMSQAPIPAPLKYIPENGGGGGKPPGPAVDNSQFDYETEAYGIDPDYGLTEEEQEALDNQIAGPKTSTLGKIGTTLGFMTAPFTTAINKYRTDKKKQKELEEKTRQAGIQADFDRAMAQGDSFYDGLNEGRGASVSKESRENAGAGFNDNTPGNPFAKGGRVGYFFGGRVNYKTGGRVSFKNGGLASIL